MCVSLHYCYSLSLHSISSSEITSSSSAAAAAGINSTLDCFFATFFLLAVDAPADVGALPFFCIFKVV